MRVLQVAAEIYPLVKTGGLADVMGALPAALRAAGQDVRVILPGLPAILAGVAQQTRICSFAAPCGGAATLRRGRIGGAALAVYVIDAPHLYAREGSPYQAPDGSDWPDNLQRFAMLGWAAAYLAAGELDPDWQADVLHAHDWHAGLACAYLAARHAGREGAKPAAVFTVHNLTYQGLFPAADFAQLGLPQRFFSLHGLEFWDKLSFMKAGLQFANRITTVSPSYAHEIATEAFGCGLHGVIQERGADVVGILNGVDPLVWNSAADVALTAHYTAQQLAGKAVCKQALQCEAGLAPQADAPLFGVVSRLTEQKGLDLLLGALPAVLRAGGQLVLLGSGDAALEAACHDAAQHHPGSVAVRIGYDETYAHRLIAGADCIVVPSRFEPCGLTQLYGLRYGTLPLVRRVGGLADTVIDPAAESGEGDAAYWSASATGLQFLDAHVPALEQALLRAISLYRDQSAWAAAMRRAMQQDFSWAVAAAQYAALYKAVTA